jgi:hypothetical protein
MMTAIPIFIIGGLAAGFVFWMVWVTNHVAKGK